MKDGFTETNDKFVLLITGSTSTFKKHLFFNFTNNILKKKKKDKPSLQDI